MHVESMMDKNLHLNKNHPINIIKARIEDFFHQQWTPTSGLNCRAAKDNAGVKMAIFDNLSPVISTTQAFDELLFEPNHPGRSPIDTYYINPDTVLRPHTSAHQNELLRSGVHSFLCTGDV
jgi:phenylalanyl-tRNA synthetase alpha chain